jgi:hypothetical protein
VVRWVVACGERASGAGCAEYSNPRSPTHMTGGTGAQGGKMAAWQKAQVASSCTGTGSDSRGALMTGRL